MALIPGKLKKQKPVGTQLKEAWGGMPGWVESAVNFVTPDPNEPPMFGTAALDPKFLSRISNFAPEERAVAKGFMSNINRVIDSIFPGKSLQELSEPEINKVMEGVEKMVARPSMTKPPSLEFRRAGDQLKQAIR